MFVGTNEQLINALKTMPIRGGVAGQQVALASADEIARLTAALAESEASKGALIERIQDAVWDEAKQLHVDKALGEEIARICDVVSEVDPDATAALAAYVKQAVEAETRACAEVCDGMDSWESPRAVNRAILARLDQRKEVV